jgi:phenylalanyl-tRNA synthetase beta chain
LAGGVVDAWPKPNEPRQIVLRHSQTDALIGIPIPVQQQVENLKRLGLDLIETRPAPASNPNGASSVFKIPSFRVDLKGEVDLIEEIVRLYGVDKVPATPPRGATGSSVFDSIHDELSEARRLLAALGLNEAQGQTLISETNARVITNHGMVALANPLSSDMNVLRPSLLPGLLDSLRHNLHHRNQDVALFELGRVFKRSNSTPANPGRQKPDESNPVVGNVLETRHLAIALTGQRSPLFWQGADRDARADIYDLKGLLEEFFERFGIRGISYNRRAQPTSLFIESASIHLGKFEIGQLGQVTPALAKRYDLRDATLLAELDLDVLLPKRNLSRNFKAIPAQPSIRRDVAMLVPEPTTHESVVQTARQAKPDNLENIELFDVFRGKNIPAGQKSVAYAFTYRSPDRTLTDAEVNAAHERLVGQLKEKLHAVVREG